MKQLSEAEMLHRAAAYCSTAERCIQDVEKKIRAAGLSCEASERIIDRLVKEKYIDEIRYSRSFVNDKMRFNKWGKVKIGYELRKKNIAATDIEEAFSAIDEEEYLSILSDLLKEKQRTSKGKNERDLYYKLLRFACGRGFEPREITACLKSIGKYEEDME
ncbi:regulatory protein RecX [Parabacteroides sp. PF5-9]|uniref:regulatory protein RecX n=1 Tax=Parabacteroides sp. PF5-9 TaxID=1742404 RepID=UPI00247421FA|nr:regulatory protein RecX [Parabacteroides sp. PF5-9]MDH6356282.1 regulatory protein [Parabacteroides sp. PF5-9]